MRLSALILDVDGTLAETEEAHRRAFNESFAAAGLGWRWSRETYAGLLRTAGGRERLRAFQSGLPEGERLAADAIAALHRDKTARYREIVAGGGLALRPGVAVLVARARARGLRLAVATTTGRENVETLTAACWGRPAAAVFDAIATGDEVAAKKPAPDVYRLALARLGLAPAACLAVEDSRIGLRAALAAGIATVVTPSAWTRGEDFAGALAVLPSLAALDLGRIAA